MPGNHDVPLFDLAARAMRPHAAYGRWISASLEPRVDTEQARIIGLDTTDPVRHQRGRVTAGKIARTARLMTQAQGRLPLVLAHHPFHHKPEVSKAVMRGGAEALAARDVCGPHVILSGHLHQFLVEPLVARKGDGSRLQVH